MNSYRIIILNFKQITKLSKVYFYKRGSRWKWFTDKMS